jgi:L-2,4-diaminobutyric acid acetyltransferase
MEAEVALDVPDTKRKVVVTTPVMADGAAIWRIARDSSTLDLNSSYAYLLWCRDFAHTSAIATLDGDEVGFVLGYSRPQAPDTLLIWQISVDEKHRGRGIAAALLDDVVRRAMDAGVKHLETTITPDNTASIRLFTALAERWDTPLARTPLFRTAHFPDDHSAEDLFRVGPFVTAPPSTRNRHSDVALTLSGDIAPRN